MSYDSLDYSNYDIGAGIPATVSNTPLVKWKQGGEGYQPPTDATDANAEVYTWDYTNGGPSDQDAEGIKALYPWEG